MLSLNSYFLFIFIEVSWPGGSAVYTHLLFYRYALESKENLSSFA